MYQEIEYTMPLIGINPHWNQNKFSITTSKFAIGVTSSVLCIHWQSDNFEMHSEIHVLSNEMFEYTNEVIKSRQSMDRQYSGHKNEDSIQTMI